MADAPASPEAALPATHRATCRAGSNIAFIKYWGVADPALNIPLNSSISMTLADAFTTTTVTWDAHAALAEDWVELDGERLQGKRAARIVAHLDRLRNLAGVSWRAAVVSRNNFPTAAGIASSASGFAALTVAGCAALGLDLEPTRLSAIARRASGSASRSLFGGFVEWRQGTGDADSVAVPLHPPEHWDLRDIVVVVSQGEKAVSSAQGHLLAATSPLLEGRMAHVDAWLARVREALAARDLAALGPILELDALAMHSVMMTSTPSLLYWQPATLEILLAVRRWREEEGVPVYFTIDAGPNVHLICEAATEPTVRARLAALANVQQVLVSRPGPAPEIVRNA
ncbi:MAG: diphosphomevalonate decarboxylase [Caldilineae bacterium]|nr:MAG: diphosphomevalonate decarboxylase [Caldilineae bacterium]